MSAPGWSGPAALSPSSPEAGAHSGKVTKVLFVTWDGPQSTYLQSLFLPVFQRLGRYGYAFHVLQFTWAETSSRRLTGEVARKLGVPYTSISVMRTPVTLGSFITALTGAYHVVRYARKHAIEILMPRSILPALSVLVARRALPDVKLAFDADGLPVDERIDFSGMSPHSLAAVVLRDIEATAVRRADAVLTRSYEAHRILLARAGAGTGEAKFFRVANCRDEAHFRPMDIDNRREVRSMLGVPLDAPLVTYAGSSLQGKYCGEKMLEFFERVQALRPDAQFLILTTSPEEAAGLVQNAGARNCHVLRVDPEQVPLYLSACDVGLAFIKPSFSMKAAAAVKLGEYLLCGLPVVATSGIGDADESVPAGVCFLLDGTSGARLQAAAEWFSREVLGNAHELSALARKVGVELYGMTAGVSQYRAALAFAEASDVTLASEQ